MLFSMNENFFSWLRNIFFYPERAISISFVYFVVHKRIPMDFAESQFVYVRKSHHIIGDSKRSSALEFDHRRTIQLVVLNVTLLLMTDMIMLVITSSVLGQQTHSCFVTFWGHQPSIVPQLHDKSHIVYYNKMLSYASIDSRLLWLI